MKRIAPVAMAATLTAALTAVMSITSPPPATAADYDLNALHVTASWAFLPDTATSLSAQAKLTGPRGWRFYLNNLSTATVTNPSVTLDSGLSPTLFQWGGEQVTSFPATKTQDTLLPGQTMGLDLSSSIPVRFTAGYDSTRTVDTAMIQVGGSQQTVTVTVAPRDPRYNKLQSCFDIIVASNLPEVSLVKWSGPIGTTNPNDNPDSLAGLRLCGGLSTHLTYTFTATLNVPNTYGTAFRFQPDVSLNGQLVTSSTLVTGPSVVIQDTTLNGNGKQARGASTFSVSESNHTWLASHAEAADIDYAGTRHVPSAPQNVTAIPGSASATVGWTAPATVGSTPISAYEARAYTAPSGGTPVATCPASPQTLSCSLTDLTNNTEYWVDVVATNGIGASDPSQRVAVTPKP
jgi:hypothetical protein